MAEVESQELKAMENRPAKPTPQSAPRLSAIWRVLILASLIMAVGAAALLVVSAGNYQQIRREVTAQQESVRKLQTSSQQVDAQLVQQQLSAQSLLANLEQLRATTNRDPVGPVLIEVDYLARLALYNAQYSGDVKVVLALLEAAERRVSSLSSAQLADVRGALVTSITALKGIKAVDIEGVLLRLNALSTTVADLPVVRQVNLTPVAPKANAAPPVSEVASEPWKEKLLSSLSEIKKVVVVRHLSEPVKPLIAPEQHVNLVENIQLKLAIAQWAALHREPAIYTAAIAQAKDWVAHYFSDSEMTRAMVTGLEELNKIDIKPALPDITATVSVIDQAMESHRQSVATSAPASSTAPELAPGATTTPASPSTPAAGSATTPGSKNIPAPAGAPAPATPLKAKPQNPTEPEVISS